MSKYYKHHNGFIVKWLKDNPDNYFTGIVMRVGGSKWNVGNKDNYFYLPYLEPYTPTPQELIEWGETETLSNDNSNKVEVDDKYVNLRLECLKLAMQGNIVDPLSRAKRFYGWITTNQ